MSSIKPQALSHTAPRHCSPAWTRLNYCDCSVEVFHPPTLVYGSLIFYDANWDGKLYCFGEFEKNSYLFFRSFNPREIERDAPNSRYRRRLERHSRVQIFSFILLAYVIYISSEEVEMQTKKYRGVISQEKFLTRLHISLVFFFFSAVRWPVISLSLGYLPCALYISEIERIFIYGGEKLDSLLRIIGLSLLHTRGAVGKSYLPGKTRRYTHSLSVVRK